MTDDDKSLVDRLRDEDSYYSLQEKHWCIDYDLLKQLHLEAADRIEDLEQRLRGYRGCSPKF
jgi:hypothetical protein